MDMEGEDVLKSRTNLLLKFNRVAAWNLRCDYWMFVKVRDRKHIAPACSSMFCCGLVWLFVAMMTFLQLGPKLDRT